MRHALVAAAGFVLCAGLLDHTSPLAAPASDLVFTGACDASAALVTASGHLLVADDEDRTETRLRVYDVQSPGAPIASLDVTSALAPDPADAEVDLEGLTAFGERFALIGSHSRKGDDAAAAPSRRRLMAFTLSGSPPFTLSAGGRYTRLVEDAQAFLKTLPASNPARAVVLDRPLGSKAGGLSIEALSETRTKGELLIGLRSPLGPGDTAIVLPLTNAAAVLDRQAAPVFAAPVLLALGGHGLRDLQPDGKGGYLLLSGNPGEGGTFALWAWGGPGAPAPRRLMPIAADADTSAEGLAVTAAHDAVWILFDEGERRTTSGKRCKSKDVPASAKSFRARKVALPAS